VEVVKDRGGDIYTQEPKKKSNSHHFRIFLEELSQRAEEKASRHQSAYESSKTDGFMPYFRDVLHTQLNLPRHPRARGSHCKRSAKCRSGNRIIIFHQSDFASLEQCLPNVPSFRYLGGVYTRT
jgi:hypothetical protein